MQSGWYEVWGTLQYAEQGIARVQSLECSLMGMSKGITEDVPVGGEDPGRGTGMDAEHATARGHHPFLAGAPASAASTARSSCSTSVCERNRMKRACDHCGSDIAPRYRSCFRR